MMEKHANLLALCARFFLCMSMFWNAGFTIAVWNVQVAMLTPLTQSFTEPMLASMTAADFVLGTAILIGYMSRHMACVAAVYSFSSACVMHSFWTSSPSMVPSDSMHFFQSVGVAGGFLLLAAFGPGQFSVDEKLKEPAATAEPKVETKV